MEGGKKMTGRSEIGWETEREGGGRESRNEKHIFMILFCRIEAPISLSLSHSLHLFPCSNSPVCLFSSLPTSLSPSIHLSFLSSLPPSLCQLAHVNFAFPHCFSRGKCLCFWLSPEPCFNTRSPSSSSPSPQHTHTHCTNIIHHILRCCWAVEWLFCNQTLIDCLYVSLS